MAEIKSVSIAHNEIMDYLMSHPNERLQDVAKYFNYTGPWLSQIIHSDAFQVMLKAKQGVAFHATVLPIREKMNIVAHEALDKIIQMLPTETDLRLINDVAEGTLDRLGYGAKPVGGGVTVNLQNNLITPNANSAEIAEARALLAARKPALGVQVDGISQPLALPRASFTEMGETVGETNISSSDRENPARETGVEV